MGVIVGSCSADTVAVECVDAQGMTLWLSARKAGHVPLATFDKELGKLDDVERL